MYAIRSYYVKTVFRTVIDDWGFSFVKLDFLYAACMTGAHGFSRGELMGRAMDFLRETVGDGKILGCGVPLASAFGVVDYCRIGCDVSLDWDGSPAWRRITSYNVCYTKLLRQQLTCAWLVWKRGTIPIPFAAEFNCGNVTNWIGFNPP